MVERKSKFCQNCFNLTTDGANGINKSLEGFKKFKCLMAFSVVYVSYIERQCSMFSQNAKC